MIFNNNKELKVGDKVIYSKYSGTEVELDNEKYVVVKQNDILAVIEQEQRSEKDPMNEN